MKKLVILLIAVLLFASSCKMQDGTYADIQENRTDVENSNVGSENENDINTGIASCENNNLNGEEATNSKDNSAENDNENKDADNKESDISTPVKPQNTICPEFSDDRWIITPSYTFDSLETFGKSGYSIYIKDGKYGILDMTASGIGTGDYSELFYCPSHGLSCPDILDTPIKMRDDLYLAPDCGYEYDKKSEVIYVFDPTRDRVYVTGYSDGYFKIADITDTEFFTKNERYTVVLYDCDADLMMYEGIGVPDLQSIFAFENKEMRYGVIDKDMDYVIACIYESVLDGNDCYIVKKDGKYGYRAVGGREYYPCVFEEANTAYKGAAWVKYGGLWGTVRF